MSEMCIRDRYTLIVLGVSAAVAAILGTLDSFFGMLFKKLILGA